MTPRPSPPPRSAPHPRGWSRFERLWAYFTGVGPAPAGMVPHSGGQGPTSRRRPRTRGDGPAMSRASSSVTRSAPHPRGWSFRAGSTTPHAAVGPAPAGMVLDHDVVEDADQGRPRTRGDGPHQRSNRLARVASAPHPRGWSVRQTTQTLHDSVGPAPAGMVRTTRTDLEGSVGRPRTRGDGPRLGSVSSQGTVSAPHPRGWSDTVEAVEDLYEVGPAPAGMVRRRSSTPDVNWSRPRTRGDGPRQVVAGGLGLGSAPHPRGWSSHGRRHWRSSWVGPAPAGMVLDRWCRLGREQGRPRTRGDGPSDSRFCRLIVWSAPHPRGWSFPDLTTIAPRWVGPAPAGMVRVDIATDRLRRCRPRTRGDGPPPTLLGQLLTKSAPHPRGWSRRIRREVGAGRVGPAPAGMVLPLAPPLRQRTRRPRTRGDGPH